MFRKIGIILCMFFLVLPIISSSEDTGLYSKPSVDQCNNNIREGTEECDGTDDLDCPGRCMIDCKCLGNEFQKITPEKLDAPEVFDINMDQRLRLDNGRIAYVAGEGAQEKIVVYDFMTEERFDIYPLLDNSQIIRFDLKDNLVSYFTIDTTPDYSLYISLYLYDIETHQHTVIDQNMNGFIGLLDITSDNVVYGNIDSSSPDPSIFVYDILTGDIQGITGSTSDLHLTYGNKVLYPDLDENHEETKECLSRLTVYDLDLEENSVYSDLPYLGNVIAFEDNLIIYQKCEYPYLSNDIFYLYDLTSGEYDILTYDSNEGSPIQFYTSGFITIGSNVHSAAITNGAYFTPGYDGNQIIYYDYNEYTELSGGLETGYFEVEGGRLCFIASDYNIYCRDVLFCGNEIQEGTEECDGTDDLDCPGLCNYDCTCGQAPPLPDDMILYGGWNLISIPFEDGLSINDLEAAGDCSINSARTWNSDLEETEKVNFLEPFVGYFVDVVDDCSLDLLGVLIQEYSLNLNSGWNLIGAPIEKDKLDDVTGTCDSTDFLWGWKHDHVHGSSYYDSVNMLKPFEGYWIYVEEDCVFGDVPGDVNLELSVATLKDDYEVDEHIELTAALDSVLQSEPDQLTGFAVSGLGTSSPTDHDHYGVSSSLAGFCGDGVCNFNETREDCLDDCESEIPEKIFAEVIAFAGEDILTYVGKETKFYGKAHYLQDDRLSYEWDFDGDGLFDWSSVVGEVVTHVYSLPGEYKATLRVTTLDGYIARDVIKVVVLAGDGDIQYIPKRPAPLEITRTGMSLTSDGLGIAADGQTTYYAVMINGGREERFWIDVELQYETLKRDYGFSDDRIYLLNYGGLNPYGENPGLMIDYSASIENLDIVFGELINKVDEDDIIFIWIDDHGGGYCGPTNVYYGFSYSKPEVEPGDEHDYLESDFKYRSLFIGHDYRRNIGLNEWGLYRVGTYNEYCAGYKYYRKMFVSHYTSIELEGGSVFSDDDVWIEEVLDYLNGDINRDGCIDYAVGDVLDFDNDGVLPYNPDTYEFDEDDWGKSNVINDDYTICETPEFNDDCVFDYGLDDIVDIDINYTDTLEVDGSDLDNEGLFDGVDINDDGDMDDWVSIDEYACLYSGRLYDDDLKYYLDQLNPSLKIVFLEPCFAGGFVDDLSSPDTIVMSANIEEDFSWGNIFVRGFSTALSEPRLSDSDGDGHVSMVEAFNYAAINDHIEDPQYDDNGDRISHTDPIPNGGEGTLGSTVYFEYRSQSKLVNHGTSAVTGTLTLKLQKNVSNEWITEEEVYSAQETLDVDEVVKLDQIWNPLEVSADNAGIYRVYSEFDYTSGKINASWEFEVSGETLQLEMSVATLKDDYEVDEHIELTDTLDVVIPISSEAVSAVQSTGAVVSEVQEESITGMVTGGINGVDEEQGVKILTQNTIAPSTSGVQTITSSSLTLEEELPTHAPGEFIVKFKESTKITRPNILSRAFGASKISTDYDSINNLNKKYKITGTEELFKSSSNKITGNAVAPLKEDSQPKIIVKLKTSSQEDIEKITKDYANDPNIEYAEPNYIAYTSLYPNDPMYNQQWAHWKTGARDGWDIEKGNSSIVIAIVDTGVTYDHEDLKDNIWNNSDEDCNSDTDLDGNGFNGDCGGYDFVDIDTQEYIDDGYELIPEEDYTERDNNVSDYNGHGTHCAGIAAGVGNNGIGISGVCPNCTIMPLRAGFSIIHNSGVYGSLAYEDVAAAIIYAADNGANVISMSFGSSYSSQLQKDAIDYAYSKGVTLIAAAGNGRTDSYSYPAAFDNVISVTSTDTLDRRSGFSNYGYWTDVAAPGSIILSTVPLTGTISDESGYKQISGTSMAAPYVAGLAGLILSKNDSWNNSEIKKILRQGVDAPDEQFKYIGTGRVNVNKALKIDSLSSAVAEINYPVNEEIIYGDININGTADGNYVVEYGKGIYPTEWVEIGKGGAVIDSNLTRWDTSDVNDDTYKIRLMVIDDHGFTEDFKLVTLVTDIKPGWPKLFGGGYNSHINSPLCEDLDNDGKKEVISIYFSDLSNAKLYVWNYSGALVDNFPYDFNEGVSSSSPSIADIDNDGEKEIVMTTRYSIFVFSSNGSIEWSRNLGGEAYFGKSSPVLVDLDNDGDMEIVSGLESAYTLWGASTCVEDIDCVSYDPFAVCPWGKCAYFQNRLFAFHHDGSYVSGWPIKTIAAAAPVVGDIDNDGDMEIVVMSGGLGPIGNYSAVEVFNADGTPFGYNWPVKLFNHVSSGMGYSWVTPLMPLLANLDEDPNLEIIVNPGPYKYNSDGTVFMSNNETFAFKFDGTEISNWPVELPEKRSFHSGPNSFGMAAGDVDNDGTIEFAVGDRAGGTHLINQDGTQLNNWPKYSEIDDDRLKGSPLMADLDGDNSLDVVIAYKKDGIHVLDKNGDFVGSFPKRLSNDIYSTPTVCDLEGDGITDLIVTDAFGNVFVYEVGSYEEDSMQWPMFQHDPQHTGNYNLGHITPETRPQSKLVNLNTNPVSGKLELRLEKNISNEWTYEGVVYSEDITLQPLEVLKLDEIWNPLEVSADNAGNYRVYSEFDYGSGNINASWEFEVSGEEIQLEISVATLKDDYEVDEHIELTDTPDGVLQSDSAATVPAVQSTGAVVSEISEAGITGMVVGEITGLNGKKQGVNTLNNKIRVDRNNDMGTYAFNLNNIPRTDNSLFNPLYSFVQEENEGGITNFPAKAMTQFQGELESLKSKISNSLESSIPNKPKHKGYIIKFKDKSVIEKKNDLEVEAKENEESIDSMGSYNPLKYVKPLFVVTPDEVLNKVESYDNKIVSKKEKIKTKIKKKLKNSNSITGNAIGANSDELSTLGEFTRVFNGIVLDISEEEAKEIEKLRDVDRVYTNNMVKAALMDSVSLINADDIWMLDKDGNDCLTSGKTCLTGNGTTIAIIDTGVDYTHPDLGGCFGGEVGYEEVVVDFLDFPDEFFSESSISSEQVAKIIRAQHLSLKNMHSGHTPYDDIIVEYHPDWYGGTLPYGIGLGDSAFPGMNKGNHRWEVMGHEQGHNFFGTKGNWYWELVEEGPFIQESFAVLSSVYTYQDISHNSELLSVTIDSLDYVFQNEINYQEEMYGEYITKGNNFDINNVQTSQALDYKMIVYGGAYGWDNYKLFTMAFEEGISDRFTFQDDGVSDTEKVTYVIAALGAAFNADFRSEFVELNFPIDDGLYDEIKPKIGSYIFQHRGAGDCKVIGGYDFVNNDNDPMDDVGHGTHCAGIAAGNGVLKGVAPDAKLYAFKVLDYNGEGYWGDIIKAINRSFDLDNDGYVYGIDLEEDNPQDIVDVISLSLGGPGNPDDELSITIDNAVGAGVIAVISAGNSGPSYETIGSPGTSRNAITVGATYKSNLELVNYGPCTDSDTSVDDIACISSRGPVSWEDSDGTTNYLMKPDIVAPGVEICSSQWDTAYGIDEDFENPDRPDVHQCLDNQHMAITGTSMAAPHVAGAAALLKQMNPYFKPIDIKNILMENAVDLGYGARVQGKGRLNLEFTKQKPNFVMLDEIKLKIPFEITGEINVEDFKEYNLTLKMELGDDWIEISSGDHIPDVLGSSDLGILPDGGYTIRLVVNDMDNNEYVDEGYFYLEKFDFVFPKQEAVLNNKDIYPIKVKNNIPGFALDSYDIKVYEIDSYGSSPVDGSTLGIELVDEGDIMGYWDTSYYDAGLYGLTVNLNYKGIETSFSNEIFLDEHLLSGFPKSTQDTSGVWGIFRTSLALINQPTIYDLNDDGIKEIILAYGEGEGNAKVYAFEPDGNQLAGFPVVLPADSVQMGPVAQDYDNDGYGEIIVMAYTGCRDLFKIEHDGSFTFSDRCLDFNPIFSDDLDGDGNLEMFGLAYDWPDEGKVRLIDDNFDSFNSNWPVDMGDYMPEDEETANGSLFYFIDDRILSLDVDLDGQKELIVQTFTGQIVQTEYGFSSIPINTSLYAFNPDGSIALGWPKHFSEFLSCNLIADVDKDQEPEMLCGSSEESEDQQNISVIILSHDGAIEKNYKYEFENTAESSFEFYSLSVGDIDNERKIIISGRHMSGFPSSYSVGSISLLIDIDGNLETITSPGSFYNSMFYPIGKVTSSPNTEFSLGYHYGLNKDGDWIRGMGSTSYFTDRSDNKFEFYMADGELGDGKVISDLDGDGINEVISIDRLGDIYVWSAGGGGYDDEWNEIFYDSAHTNCFKCENLDYRPQSKLVNPNTNPVSGKLELRLEKNVSNEWIYEGVVYSEDITLQPSEVLKLDQIWNPLEVSADNAGMYRVYAEFDYTHDKINASWKIGVVG
jgi:subtilisin family serine protease